MNKLKYRLQLVALSIRGKRN